MTRHRNPVHGRTPDLSSAVAGLRELDGSADEVEALARRLAPQLAAPTLLASLPSGPATLLKVVSGLVVGTALMGGLALLASMREETKPKPLRALPPVRVSATPIALTESDEFQVEAMPAAERVVEPLAQHPRAAAPRARKRAGVPSKAAPLSVAQVGSVEAELELLSRAQAALGTAPLAALGLCKEHAQHYARGVFAQEREVIAIEAEMKMGRSEVAARRARRFLQAYPRSTHSRRVRALVAEDEIAPQDNNAGLEPTPN